MRCFQQCGNCNGFDFNLEMCRQHSRMPEPIWSSQQQGLKGDRLQQIELSVVGSDL
jgi:hypothetical protein